MKSTEPTNIFKLGVKKTDQSAPTICLICMIARLPVKAKSHMRRVKRKCTVLNDHMYLISHFSGRKFCVL